MNNILIRSIDRDTHPTLTQKQPGYNSTDFKVTLNASIQNGRKIHLEHLSMYNNVYNINKNNNTFIYSLNNLELSFEIPQGFYNASNLGLKIQTLMGLSGYSVIFDTSMDKFTFSNLSSQTVSVFFDKMEQLSTVMGMEPKIYTNTFTSPNICLISPLNSVGIVVNTYTNDMYSTSTSNFTFYIPFNVSSSSLVSYNPNSSFTQSASIHDNGQYITSFTVRVISLDDGLPVDLNGSEWEMVVKIT